MKSVQASHPAHNDTTMKSVQAPHPGTSNGSNLVNNGFPSMLDSYDADDDMDVRHYDNDNFGGIRSGLYPCRY